MICPYPHCRTLLEDDSKFTYHDACGRRLCYCAVCGHPNTVFNRYCTNCQRQMTPLSSWNQPWGNAKRNANPAGPFRHTINFSEIWHYPLKSRDHAIHTVFIGGDLVLALSSADRMELVGLHNGVNKVNRDIAKWTMQSGRLHLASMPINIGHRIVYLIQKQSGYQLQEINLLTLASQYIPLTLENAIDPNHSPIVMALQDHQPGDFIICLQTSFDPVFINATQSYKPIHSESHGFPSGKTWWKTVSHGNQMFQVSQTGDFVVWSVSPDKITCTVKNFYDGQYFQPTLFTNQIDHSSFIFLPFRDRDGNWKVRFASFTKQCDLNAFSIVEIQENISENFNLANLFEFIGINTPIGSVFLEGNRIFSMAVKDKRFTLNTFQLLSNQPMGHQYAFCVSMMLIYCDTTGNLCGLNLTRLFFKEAQSIPISNFTTESRRVITGFIWHDSHVLIQDMEKLVCIRADR